MPRYSDSIVRQFDSPNSGNASEFETVYVTQGGNPASIFSNDAMTQSKPNPFTTDKEGFFTFCAESGDYTLHIGSPARKSIPVGIGGGGDSIQIGTSLISNKDLGDDYIFRDGQTYNVADYPELAGTPGFPYYGMITTFTPQADYTSSVAFGAAGLSYAADSFIDRNGNIFAWSGGDKDFMFSETDGNTETEVVGATAYTTLCVATDEKDYIVSVGGGTSTSKIEIFDYNTRALIRSESGLTTNRFVYVETNTEGTFTAVDISGGVYKSDTSADNWNYVAQIYGLPMDIGFFRKTASGYLIYASHGSYRSLYFIDSIDGSGTASLSWSNPDPSFIDIFYACNKDSDFVIAIQNDNNPSPRKYLSSYDGGQSYQEFTPSTPLPDGVRIGDIKHVSDQAFVLYDYTAGRCWFSNDYGDTYTQILTPLYSNQSASIYLNFSNDIIIARDATTSRGKATSDYGSPTMFTSTKLDNPSYYDRYQVRAK